MRNVNVQIECTRIISFNEVMWKLHQEQSSPLKVTWPTLGGTGQPASQRLLTNGPANSRRGRPLRERGCGCGGGWANTFYIMSCMTNDNDDRRREVEGKEGGISLWTCGDTTLMTMFLWPITYVSVCVVLYFLCPFLMPREDTTASLRHLFSKSSLARLLRLPW